MTLKAIEPLAHQPDGEHEIGDHLPDVCGIADVAKVLRVSYDHAIKLQRHGKLRHLLLTNPITVKRYSGKKLTAYRNSEDVGARAFFGSARKRA